MSIWDDLYSGFVRAELKAESADAKDFLSVEAKVEDLRRRVGLNTYDMAKHAAPIEKSAGQSFRLVIAQEEDASNSEADINALMEIKGYLMQLLDMRRAGIQADAALFEVKNKFPNYEELIGNNKGELKHFIEEYQQKFRTSPSSPAPSPNTVKIDPTEDNATFENSAEKLKM